MKEQGFEKEFDETEYLKIVLNKQYGNIDDLINEIGEENVKKLKILGYIEFE